MTNTATGPQTATDAERVSDIVAVAWRWRWGKLGSNTAWHISLEKPGPFAEEGYEVEPLYTDAIIEAQSKALAGARVNSVMLEEISDALNVAVANTKRATERAQKAEAALAEAREYAARLLVSFVTEHCNPVPEWAPLPDLMGVLTQLDNATTITRDMKAALAEATAMDAALTSCAAMLAFLRQREGECLGDHPDWLRRIDGIFTAHAAVIATPVPDRALVTPTPENPNG